MTEETRAALEFYAKRDNYRAPGVHYPEPIMTDFGAMARIALEQPSAEVLLQRVKDYHEAGLFAIDPAILEQLFTELGETRLAAAVHRARGTL